MFCGSLSQCISFQKEILVRTQMSSTSFTQNEQVFMLLRLRSVQSEEELKQALHLIQFRPPEPKDVLPFLPDFLDALFTVLERFVRICSAILRLLNRHPGARRLTGSWSSMRSWWWLAL